MYVWRAIQLCSMCNSGFPDWVVQYLRRAADRIEYVYEDRGSDGIDLGSVIADVFGFKPLGQGRMEPLEIQVLVKYGN